MRRLWHPRSRRLWHPGLAPLVARALAPPARPGHRRL